MPAEDCFKNYNNNVFNVLCIKEETPLHLACENYHKADGSESLRAIVHLIMSNSDIKSKDVVSNKTYRC